ncbi:MAG: helix-turn-helix domain-containing protein [Prevotellaceae bacterium]|nr:helix-turn-helix domain-containing protein [Prevotellaceae bacterium]
MDNGEVCKALHLAPRTLQEYRDKRVIPYIKLGGKILYRESNVLRMLEENHYKAAN